MYLSDYVLITFGSNGENCGGYPIIDKSYWLCEGSTVFVPLLEHKPSHFMPHSHFMCDKICEAIIKHHQNVTSKNTALSIYLCGFMIVFNYYIIFK